jgi:GDP-L-fucose synthase
LDILLTGGNGFIGRNIKEALSSRYNILAPGHRELDLLDAEAVRSYLVSKKVDLIIHCAVKPGHRNSSDSMGLFYSNTRMFFNLVSNLELFGKMLFISSGAIYDERHYAPKMSEDYFDAYVPADEHGYSKYVCAKYGQLLGGKFVELRLFGVFGKHEDYAIRFISNAICKTFFDLPITIKQNRTLDYLYIDDLMPVLEHFIHQRGEFCSYNVTPDRTPDLYTLAEKVKAISGKDLSIMVAQPGLGQEYTGANSRLRKEIPGIKFTPIDDAIDLLYNWYAQHIHLIDRDRLLFDK